MERVIWGGGGLVVLSSTTWGRGEIFEDDGRHFIMKEKGRILQISAAGHLQRDAVRRL